MKTTPPLLSGFWGLEREALRVDASGRLSTRPHPFPPEERAITVDFAEAQAELITGVHDSPEAALDELASLQERLLAAVPDELLWPFSLPGVWAGDRSAPSARFADHPDWEDQRRYRKNLARTHGPARQILSGVHVNFSFNPARGDADSFALIRNFLRYQPLLTFLFAASPWLEDRLRRDLARQRAGATGLAGRVCRGRTASVRTGPLGYGLDPDLEAQIDVRFDSLDEYLEKLERALRPRDGRPPLLSHEREFYAPVRPKAASSEKGRTLASLRARGVGYLEFRNFDLDPFAPLGLAEDTLRFFQLFLAACSSLPSPRLDPAERARISAVDRELSMCGLHDEAHRHPGLRAIAQAVFPAIEELAATASDEHRRVVGRLRGQLRGEAPRPVDRLRSWWGDDPATPLAWGLERARLHRAWPALELSTRQLIREADARGARVTLLDAADNFIGLEWDGRTEFVKQATRTSADPYIAALIMENKTVTKAVLRRAGLHVPEGGAFTSVGGALAARGRFAGRKVVIKPNSTNFGEGVVILEADAPEAAWRAALEAALALDSQVLVEEFAAGLEFRFLVIGGKTRAILHRVPANVVGDGRGSIRELVAGKNRHPWRGEGYRKPLEKIRLDETERTFLVAQGLTPDSVPALGETIFLRKNSNISTGGDSIDYTDLMPAVYRRRAEAAAAAVGARICGLDMILPDWRDESPEAVSTILELNFNPALHIHDFPAVGRNRHVEGHVLDVLGLRVGGDGPTNPVGEETHTVAEAVLECCGA